MKKIWLAVIGVAVLAMVLVGLVSCTTTSNPGGTNVNVNSQQTGIWVSGEGKVPATPDTAILSVGVQVQDADVAQAQAGAAAAMSQVVDALKANGIADKDIQTQYFSIQPVYTYDNNKQQSVITGYQVTNTVTAKVRKVADTGTVIDAVVAAGGNATRINSVSFTVDDPTPYLAQARVLAVNDAAAKAQKLAETAKVTLGKATYINESTSTPVIYRNDLAMAAGAPAPTVTTPISTGEIDITVDVQIAYGIGN